MSGFADMWRQAGEEDWEPSPGAYKVRVIDASAFVSRAGTEFAKCTLQVTDGDAKGNSWDHLMGFGSPVAARISHGNLAMYGLDVKTITDFYELQEAMPSLVGTQAEVVVKHNNGYVNTDVNRTFTGRSDVTTNTDQQQFETTPQSQTPVDDDDEPPY